MISCATDPAVQGGEGEEHCIEQYRQALEALAGLHPCITIENPIEIAKSILDHVLSEQAEARERISSLENTIQALLAIQAKRKTP